MPSTIPTKEANHTEQALICQEIGGTRLIIIPKYNGALYFDISMKYKTIFWKFLK